MAKGFKGIIEGKFPEVVADFGNGLLIAVHNAAPTDGPSGTLAGQAGTGALLLTTTGEAYLNTGDATSPAWKAITHA